ncbi:MAG: GspE/PulE family protein [Aquimonas sp.]|nr:GspE/PulE family protein [Aquimonas sp.]
MGLAEAARQTAPGIVVLDDATQIATYLSACAQGQAGWSQAELRRPVHELVALSGLPEQRLREAEQLDIPLLLKPELGMDESTLGLIPPARARQLRAVPLQQQDGHVAVAMENPTDRSAIEQLDFLSRQRVVSLLVPPGVLSDLLAVSYDRLEDIHVVRELGLDPGKVLREASDRDTERLARERSVVRIIHDLLIDALRRRASDVHLRPGEEGLDLLYRIDGGLVPVRRFLPALAPALISRIKVIGLMNLAEHRRPQDGRASMEFDDGHSADMRVSIMPTVWGESAVIRLLDTSQSLKDIEGIGFEPRDRALIEVLLERSHGMFLATGPTGCGKSTTLYALLLELRRRQQNILTVEDPVEYHIAGIQQMQVNRAVDFHFASALRNMLRHDPDVVMVGEIRDRETAAIAVDAALTGHLVLSTLHTNTAATTLTRLLDLGVESYLLRSSLLGVLAQRLVRLNCPHCLQEDAGDPRLRGLLGVAEDEVFKIGVGCGHCNGQGVKGRRAVYELLEVTPAIRSLIVPGAEADRIHDTAVAEGMRSITQSALKLAREGLISLAEAYRVRTD